MSLFCEVRGAGTPLLLLHGNPVDHRILLPLDTAFSATPGWCRYYLDLPGFGKSAETEGINSSQDVADAVVEFILDEFGDQPFAILGQSYGGLLARYVAGRLAKQVLGLALLVPAVVMDHAARQSPEHTVAERDDVFLASLNSSDRDDFVVVSRHLTADAWEQFRDAVQPGIHSFNPETVPHIEANYALPAEPEDQFGPFENPTVIITGRQDDVVGFEDQLALLPSYPAATYAVLDDAGHNAHLDQPALTQALLTNWLERISRTERASHRD